MLSGSCIIWPCMGCSSESAGCGRIAVVARDSAAVNAARHGARANSWPAAASARAGGARYVPLDQLKQHTAGGNARGPREQHAERIGKWALRREAEKYRVDDQADRIVDQEHRIGNLPEKRPDAVLRPVAGDRAAAGGDEYERGRYSDRNADAEVEQQRGARGCGQRRQPER